jgi:hypothetical protein
VTNQPEAGDRRQDSSSIGGRHEASELSGLVAHASARPTANALLTNDLVRADPISRVAGQVSVQDRIALSNARLRGGVAIAIVVTFVIANGFVLAMVWLMFAQEMVALQNKVHAASDRVVTSALLMALVGATTVQLGTLTILALTILMGKYLIPRAAAVIRYTAVPSLRV